MAYSRFIKIFLVGLVLSLLAINLFAKSFLQRLSAFNIANRNAVASVFNNFYEVEKGKFYRSQQLQPDALDMYIRRHGIKSIICLRGFKDQSICEREMAVAVKNNVQFHHIPMSAARLSEKKDLIRLLDLYQTVPKPILVHCIGGADRTGEATAIWVLEMQKRSKEEALKQLSLWYGHRIGANPAKDYLIAIWQGEEWLRNEYDHTHYPAIQSSF